MSALARESALSRRQQAEQLIHQLTGVGPAGLCQFLLGNVFDLLCRLGEVPIGGCCLQARCLSERSILTPARLATSSQASFGSVSMLPEATCRCQARVPWPGTHRRHRYKKQPMASFRTGGRRLIEQVEEVVTLLTGMACALVGATSGMHGQLLTEHVEGIVRVGCACGSAQEAGRDVDVGRW